MVTYFKGVVFDKETNKRLEAKFELTDLSTGKSVSRSSSDPVTGEFLLALPLDKEYGLNVSKPGYLFYSDHFELRGENSKAKPFIYNVPLQPIRVGETVILKNIFFDTDKFNLKEESRSELAKLIQLCGGKEAFVNRLDTYFGKNYYRGDNEPSFIQSSLYIWAGRRRKSSVFKPGCAAGRCGKRGGREALSVRIEGNLAVGVSGHHRVRRRLQGAIFPGCT